MGSPSRSASHSLSFLAALLPLACGGAASAPASPATQDPTSSSAKAPREATDDDAVTVSLVATNDVHGRLDSLPILGGYLANLRAVRGDGGVLLLDAGDIFQGTLESNLAEGVPMIIGYDALHYDAVTLGNHEFDYGPVGPKSTPREATDDPRGALKARASEASFPFLAANVAIAGTDQPVDWPNFHPTMLVKKNGISIGVIGLSTVDTPHTTITTNFAGLTILPLATVVEARAGELRKNGANLVIALAHAGGKCLSYGDDDTSCDPDQEIMRLAESLPAGTVDAIVAGHTHGGMANRVNGTAVIESFSYGKDFGRIDFTFSKKTHALEKTVILPPTKLTLPATYLGAPVVLDESLAAKLEPFTEAARAKKESPVGIELATTITRDHSHESPLGNLFADLLLRARPVATVAMMNGGGLRSDLPAGGLRYGALFEAMPFDNRLALVHLRGADLKRVVRENLFDSHGIASWAGIRIVAVCRNGRDGHDASDRGLEVTLEKDGGGLVADTDAITMVTSDFIALGGDGVAFPPNSAVIEDELVRDAFEKQLKALGRRGPLTASALYDPGHRRVSYPGERPVSCKH